ncbi:PQQ-dependent sugar dehydrogenase [Mycolicibacterium rutilum]|nr:PQQ-dependent sugar dehydrogenase [Mycolicibacterium rutilum]
MAISGYARYIGRVGALAVALGVTGAVATSPGIAWADEQTSSTGAESSDTNSNDPGPSSGTTSATDPDAESESPSETPTSGEEDVDAAPEEDADPDETEDEEAGENEEAEEPEQEPEPSDEVTDNDSTDDSTDDSSTEALPEATVRNDDTSPAPEETADDTATQDTTLLAANTHRSTTDAESQAEQAVSVTHVPVVPFRLPTPDQVVRQVRDAVTTCVCNVISGTIKLVNAAMSVFTGGGGTAGPGGPMSPLGNPLIAAVMEWARRETTRVVEFVSRTPVAQFLHGVTQQITQAVADFGNSPFGRQFSAQIGQFLAQCEESFSLPDELERVVVVGGLTEPTDFAFLPADGDSDTVDRIFITEKSGTIKVYNPSDGTVTTLTTLPTVTADGERGLVGIEVDPQFWTIGAEGYHTIYVAYTGADNFDRLSKLRLDPDTLGYQSEQELLVSTELGNNFHHGGELQFDPQGEYLYWAVGDNTEGDNAQDLSNIHGKILRLDRNGEAPSTNPYFNTPGAIKQIYATGFRNPFRFTFTPNGKLLVADVGEAEWEELNVVTPGGNYGWPSEEGECDDCEYVNPIYAYPHSAPPANAGSITAVLVYTGTTLPDEYRNKVYIADYSVGWIKELTFDQEFTSLISERTFDSKAGTTVKLDQSPDGNIYQLNIYPGQLSVIRPSGGNRGPTAVITASPTSGAGSELTVNFSADQSTDPDGDQLQYRWTFGDGRTSEEVNPTIKFTNTTGAYTAYNVTLTVTDGDKTSTATQRVVVGSTAPTATIKDTLPAKYDAGDTITFEAEGFDLEDGALPPEAYKWTVVFHHAEHTHPFRDNIIGTSGSVTIPRTRDQLGNTFYRVSLTVTDSSGLSTTTFKDIHPNTVELTFTASHPDAAFTVDGVRYVGSHVIEDAVVGVERVVSAPSPQAADGGQLVYVGWSDGLGQSHTITTPEDATEYTVTYNFVPANAVVV